MKKLWFLSALALMLCSCNGVRVRHDHSKKMESARVPVDTTQKNYVDDVTDESWKDEDLVVIPDDEGGAPSLDHADDEIERMMRGENIDPDDPGSGL